MLTGSFLLLGELLFVCLCKCDREHALTGNSSFIYETCVSKGSAERALGAPLLVENVNIIKLNVRLVTKGRCVTRIQPSSGARH